MSHISLFSEKDNVNMNLTLIDNGRCNKIN